MKNKWIVEEVHGAWWAYIPPKPNAECFFSHNRPIRPQIIGPFHCEAFAKEKAAATPTE